MAFTRYRRGEGPAPDASSSDSDASDQSETSEVSHSFSEAVHDRARTPPRDFTLDPAHNLVPSQNMPALQHTSSLAAQMSASESPSSTNASYPLRAAHPPSQLASSSGEETESEASSSDSESSSGARVLFKPRFIPKSQRTRAEDTPPESVQDPVEKRREDSLRIAAATVEHELGAHESTETSQFNGTDDTDGLDPEAEFNEWKIRELARIERDENERYARDREQQERFETRLANDTSRHVHTEAAPQRTIPGRHGQSEKSEKRTGAFYQ